MYVFIENSAKQTLNLLEGDSLLSASRGIRDLRIFYPAATKSKKLNKCYSHLTQF